MALTDPTVRRPPTAPPTPPAARPAPTETPECEASTCAGISTPESVELHNAWPGWVPLLLIALMVLSCLGFAVGRIAGW
ncbi:hypothetical protein OG689_38495 [Kitasatospora sp. NBC_00240]|uniref:hypothetical protein n=1 Tax=Kitasatospora sp. NBC_00240 TaxID=2903567 RepID=UPI00224E8AEA|nr:hypothetical protein [Kitasatospora sp. NBC_00240]MCX5215086.1 hypothetical protein [Kitasatospora sp. NBC_00240]